MLSKLAKRYSKTHLSKIVEDLRTGYNQYSFFFWIPSIVALLAGLLGVAFLLALPLTLAFFWFAGKFHKELESQRGKERKSTTT